MTLPITEPKITKELLLSKHSDETYMSTYLGIPVKRELQISPIRKDKKPTACFYRNRKGDLIFHDFGIGFHENFIGVVMYLNQCTYGQALRIIAEDFGIISKTSDRPTITIKVSDAKIEEKTDTIIQIEQQPFSNSELKWWKLFGITESTLKKYKIFSCKSVFLNGHYFASSTEKNMMFGYYGGKKNGSELWRIYFPQKRTFRFLSNWGKNLIQGVKQLPQTGEFVVLTKSLKDTMCLYEQNIPACAPCSENILISKLQMDKLQSRFNKVVLLWDNDNPGRTAALKYQDVFPNLLCIELKPEVSKDISDCCKNKKNIFTNVIEELKLIISNPDTELKYFNIITSASIKN